jgi:hypothetical protein
MDVLVTLYFPHPKGGWIDLGAGRMNVKGANGLTEKVARICLASFIQSTVPDHPDAPKPYDPEKVIASATFGDLGTLYVDGNGTPKVVA